MQKLISFDWAIKRILRSKANFEILEGFLSELIAPDKDIKIVRVLDSESNKEEATDKSNRVDILVEIDPGELVLIEVQFNTELDFLQRMLYGTSKVITEYLAEGNPYAKIKKVYSVNILYFDLGQGEDYVYKGSTTFVGIHNQKPLQLTARQKEIYHKELIKDIYPEYYIIKVNNFDNIAKNRLDEWIYFLKNEEIKSEFQAKGLLKAKQALDILKLSKEERALYRRYQDNLHYQASMVDSTYGEGKAEGLKEGLVKGKQVGLQEGLVKGKQVGLQEGLEKGKQVGLQEGLEKGKQVGLQEGLEKGKQVGLQEGLEKGKQVGLQEGLEKGKQAGLQQGLEEGKKREKLALAQLMLSEGYSLDEVILLTGLSKQEIETRTK